MIDRRVHVAVGVTGEHDGLGPGGHIGADALADDGRAEHGAVQNAADGAVGALPHLMQVVFAHSLHVGRDGRALDGNAVLLGRERALHRDGVRRLIAVHKSQIVVFGIQVDIGKDEDLFDLLPEDAGHFVAVHLHDGGRHLDLCHKYLADFFLYYTIFCRRLQLFAPEKTPRVKIPV